MKKIYLSVVCLLISIPLIAQLYVEPEKEVECSVFLAKEGRGRAQQGLEIWDDYIFSCEDGGHVNIYDFKSADPKPRSEERRVGKECRSRWSPYH